MAGKNNGSGIDYYELRRKHEEYLMAKRAQEKAAEEAAENALPQEEAAPAVENTQVAEPVADVSPAMTAPATAPDKAEDAPEEAGAYDAAADAADEAGRDEGYDDYDDEDEVSGGLFDPVLKIMKNAYQGIAGAISKKHARSDDVLDDSDDSYSDEDYSDFEPEEPQEKRGLLNIFRRHRAGEDFDTDTSETEDGEAVGNGFDVSEDGDAAETSADEVEAAADDAAPETAEAEEAADDIAYEDGPAADIEDIEDIAESPIADVEEADAEEAAEAPAYDAEDAAEADTVYADGMTEDTARYPDEDWPEKYNDDEYAADDDDGEYDDVEPADSRSFGKRVMDLFIRIERDDVYDEDDYEVYAPDEDEDDRPGYDDSLFVNDHRPYHGEEENIYMEDQTKKTPDLTELMSDGMDEKILSRRERRELRMKQEDAAAGNAESAPETPAVPELSADDVVPDEPTREYQIVTRVSKEEPAVESVSDESLFMDEDGAEEEVVVEEKPARTGLFGRARKPVEDDYDEDGYDDDEDDEEDDEPVKPRRARGRKAQKYEDDYEDDYDEDEDYDDDDYEDEPRSRVKKSRRYDDDYDDYDDDDYYDDYDDDDDAPGAGHYVLGFIKLIVALALILVVVVFGMYFADQAIEGGFAPYRFIAEKVPFIGEYLPAAEQAPALADPATLTGNDADMNGGDVAATDEPEVSSDPETGTEGTPADGETTGETEPESVG